MPESVKVTLNPIEVAIKSSGEKVVVSAAKVQVVTAGKVGPPGPAGESAEWATQVFELSSSQQVFELDDTPRSGSVFIYLNGLLERLWELVDTTITLDSSALAGDTVTVIYQKEI